jgi:preprotein translocase subunit Sec63
MKIVFFILVIFVILSSLSIEIIEAANKKKDYYEILGVPRDATDRHIQRVRYTSLFLSSLKTNSGRHNSNFFEIAQAFHQLSKKYHPDKLKNAKMSEKEREEAKAKWLEISKGSI